MISNSQPESTVQRIYLVAPEFSDVDGVAEQIVTLAIELTRRDREILVFIRRPCSTENQYLHRLKSAGIPVVQPPHRMAFLGKIDWASRDRFVRQLVRLASPFLMLPAFVVTLFSNRTFQQSIDSGRGFVSRGLSRVLLPDYLYLPLCPLQCRCKAPR